MASLKQLRRLFDIQSEHVSIVDRAANQRKFILIKRGEEGMEVTEILEKVEDALNKISEKIDKVMEKEPTLNLEIDKKGARFSKTTISQLKSMHEALTKLIAENVEETEKDDEVSAEKIMEAITKGISEEIEDKKEEKKADELTDVIKKIVEEAVKSTS